MSAMRSSGVLAVLLTAAASGCAGTQWFSRAADESDDRALAASSATDPTQSPLAADQKLLDPQSSDAGGRWNIAQPTNDPANAPLIQPARQANRDLPIAEHLSRAEHALADQRLPEARQHLDAIIQQQPAHPRAHHLLAVIADLEGRWGDAEHHYQLALQSDRNNAAIIGDLGYSYMLQGRLPLAQQHLVQAHALDPSHIKVAENLAQLYGRRGDLAAAQRTLADAMPPADAARSFSQMFPGVPVDAFSGAAPQMAMSPAQAPQQELFAANADAGMYSAAPHQMAMQPSPQGVPPAPDAYAVHGFAPEASSAASGVPYPQFSGAAVPPSGIAPATAAASQLNQSPVTTAHAERSWPPAVWPPVTATAGATAPPASTAAPSGSSKSGVVYLMQRQAAPSAGVTPNSPPTNPIAVPNGMPQAPNPTPSGQPSTSIDREAQYSTGPGSSRIVTWSNLNGQSVDVPPLPPTDEQLPSGTATGIPPGSAQQYPIAARTSPGSASGLNGGVYPQPQRQLPADRPTIYDYPSQGAPLRTTAPTLPTSSAPQSGMPVIQSAPPHAGFEIAPAATPPENPLSGYEAERRQFDQRFEQQVNQTYARSPAGYTQSPTVQMATPTYQVPTYQSPSYQPPSYQPPSHESATYQSPSYQSPSYQQPTYQAPAYQLPTGPATPLTPNGTPWPGGRETAAAVPAPYRSATSPAPTPSYYRAPTQPWDAAYPGPSISPGP